jgi:flagellar capping protein FliD
VVNVGSTASPDYRLSVGSDAYDAVTVTLAAGATPLLDTMAGGSKAAYSVNGVAVQTDSRTVTLAPGLKMTLLGESGAGVTTTLTVSREASAAKNALSAFATAYNALVETLDTHRGQGGGALAGDALLNTLTGGMRNLVNFEADSGAFANLAALGMTFDEEGVLQFSASAFDTATQGRTTGLFSFLHDFVKSADNLVDSLAGATSGMIASALETVEESIAQQEHRIQDEQDRLELFETTLTARINEADALIAALEQKVNYVTGMFDSMRAASRMYGA